MHTYSWFSSSYSRNLHNTVKQLYSQFKKKGSITFHWMGASLRVKPCFSYWSFICGPRASSINVVSGNSCTLVLWAGPCRNLFICQVEDLIPIIKLPQRRALHLTLPQPGGDRRVTFSGSLSVKVIIVALLFAKPSEHKVFSFTCVTLIERCKVSFFFFFLQKTIQIKFHHVKSASK